MVTEDQIKAMVSRFLAWKLPGSFAPDGGITFVQTHIVDNHVHVYEPSGTNVFDAVQAEEMIRHMMEGVVEIEKPDVAE